jgi:hypothetical protein
LTDTVLARVAALKTTPTLALKEQWRELFGKEPPPYNRRFLESRLAYRIQELTYGGLKKETIERLQALGEQLDGGNIVVRRTRVDNRPIAGTRLIREWQGVEHCVTVLADGSIRASSSGRATSSRRSRRRVAPLPAASSTRRRAPKG